MTTQWGVFSTEGCVDSGLWSEEEAKQAAREHRADGDDHAVAKPICDDHDEQPADDCEECAAQDEEDEEGDPGDR